jgi:hypothetical protein
LMNQVDKILTTAIPFQIQQKSNYFLKFWNFRKLFTILPKTNF